MSDLRERVARLIYRGPIKSIQDDALDTAGAILALVAEDRAALVAALRLARQRLRLILTAEDRQFGMAYMQGCAKAGVAEIRAALASAGGDHE